MTDPGRRPVRSLAPWFHLLTPPEEYAGEAAFTLGLLRQHLVGPLDTMLELGSGGGNMASHLKAAARLTLTDVSPEMLSAERHDQPRMRAPRRRHAHVAPRADVRRGPDPRRDLLHDDRGRPPAALETAFVHLRPGGAAVFEPDHIARDVRTRHRPRRRGRPGRSRRATWAGAPLPRMDDRPRSDRHDLPGRLRGPPPRARWQRDGQPRPAHRGTASRARPGWRLLADVGFDASAVVRPGGPHHLRRDAPPSHGRSRARPDRRRGIGPERPVER